MKILQQLTWLVFTLSLTALAVMGAWWLATHKSTPTPALKPPAAAIVEKVVKEDDLGSISLTSEAEHRIGLSVTPIVRKKVGRVRTYGGEITIPAGRAILVAAPLAGTLKPLASGPVTAGQSVKAGDAVFELSPMLTPDGRATLSAAFADAEGQVNNARTQLELSRVALDRAKRVLGDGAGSQRQVDEADAANRLATKTLDAALAREAVLNRALGQAETGTAATVSIESPENGVIRSLSAMPGQTVPVGAALFEVVDLETVWVRVALPVGDLDRIDRAQVARVGSLSGSPGNTVRPAIPVAAPPSANAIAATVDLFYSLQNADGKFFPGQRVGVTIPLADAADSLTVPWSAIVFDIHGGTWVYEQTAPHRYVRRRVVVAYSLGTDAILASGPPDNTSVVATGVQQIFGAETGFVK